MTNSELGTSLNVLHFRPMRISRAQRIYASVMAAIAVIGLGMHLADDVRGAVASGSPIVACLIKDLGLFSIQVNLLTAAVGMVAAVRPQSKSFLLRPSLQTALVPYIILVGVVFELLLTSSSGGIQVAADFLMHIVIPVLYVLYWLCFVPKRRLSWIEPARWLIYPVLYTIYTLARGMLSGMYPYPFVDITKLGYGAVGLNVLVLLAVVYLLGLAVAFIDRALAGQQRRG